MVGYRTKIMFSADDWVQCFKRPRRDEKIENGNTTNNIL